MNYEVEVSAEFDTEEAARKAMSDMEEAIGKHNGELIDSYILGDEDERPLT